MLYLFILPKFSPGVTRIKSISIAVCEHFEDCIIPAFIYMYNIIVVKEEIGSFYRDQVRQR